MICGAQIVPFVIPMEFCYCMFEDVCMFIILQKKAFKKCQVLSNITRSVGETNIVEKLNFTKILQNQLKGDRHLRKIVFC